MAILRAEAARSSTRPTAAWTSTRCSIVADGVNALRAPGLLRAGDHPLPAAARLHRARSRARAERRPHRALRRQESRGRAAEKTAMPRSGRGLRDDGEAETAPYLDAFRTDPAEPAWLREPRGTAIAALRRTRLSRPAARRRGALRACARWRTGRFSQATANWNSNPARCRRVSGSPRQRARLPSGRRSFGGPSAKRTSRAASRFHR